MSFESNRGQADPRVLFLARTAGGASVFLTPAGATLAARSGGSPVHVLFQGASDQVHAQGIEERAGRVNYFIGKEAAHWRTGIPTYSKVLYKSVYPGIDVVFYGSSRQNVEFDLLVAPGARPESIRIQLKGAEPARLNARGDLTVSSGPESVTIARPVAYQNRAGQRHPVPASYVLDDSGVARVQLGAYDASKPLVIDPVIAYSTYLGGSLNDVAASVAVDPAGNTYVAGYTNSVDFPLAAPFQGTYGGNQFDCFVTKLNPAGTGVIFSSYLGGSSGPGNDNGDSCSSVKVDSGGNVYLAGSTDSANFPVVNAYQGTPGVLRDGFVAKLNSSGSALIYSTFLGGNDFDDVSSLAVSGSGVATVVGQTRSTDFPRRNPYQSVFGGGEADAFLARFDASGGLVFSTYVGGAAHDFFNSVAVDSTGNSYAAGGSASTNFPTIGNALQQQNRGQWDVVITKSNPSGLPFYSTYLGGINVDRANGIAVDASRRMYVVGSTSSPDFPTRNAFQGALAGADDAFVARINAQGSQLLYSTFLGGSGSDGALKVDLDGLNHAYLTGQTWSTNFPIASAFQVTAGGIADGFVARLNTAGRLVLSSYLGGAGVDAGHGIAVLSAGTFVVVGSATSLNFPTVSPIQPQNRGGSDAFVTKVIP